MNAFLVATWLTAARADKVSIKSLGVQMGVVLGVFLDV